MPKINTWLAASRNTYALCVVPSLVASLRLCRQRVLSNGEAG